MEQATTTIELANTVVTPGTPMDATHMRHMEEGIARADLYDTIISSTKALDGSTKEPLPGADVVYDGASKAADVQAALNEGGLIYIEGLIDGFTNQFTLPDGAMVTMPFAALRAAGDTGAGTANSIRRILGMDANKCVTSGMDSGWLTFYPIVGNVVAACQFKRVDHRLYTRGYINSLIANAEVKIANLPAGYWPIYDKYISTVGSGFAISWVNITTIGEFVVKPSTTGTYVSGEWVLG